MHRCFNGSYVKEIEVALKTWTDIGDRVEKFFPGYKLDSFNPDMRFVRLGKNRFGQNIVLGSMTLSQDSIESLLGIEHNHPFECLDLAKSGSIP